MRRKGGGSSGCGGVWAELLVDTAAAAAAADGAHSPLPFLVLPLSRVLPGVAEGPCAYEGRLHVQRAGGGDEWHAIPGARLAEPNSHGARNSIFHIRAPG